MLADGQGLLITGVAIFAVAAGFLLATGLFVVQLRTARSRIAELESAGWRPVEPGVVLIGRNFRAPGSTKFVTPQPETGLTNPEPASTAGWTAIVVRDNGFAPRRQPETPFVPAEVAGVSGGMFATEEAAESFRRNHLSRFEALHERLGSLRAQCGAELAGGGTDYARRLITLPAPTPPTPAECC